MKKLAVIFSVLAFTTAAHSQDTRSGLPGTDILPEGTIQISPVVPGMGEHWANPADLPLGPIYCVHEGKIVCLEFMMAQEEFTSGKSWPELKGIEGLPPVNHTNIGFEANGHKGFEVPHYDVHLYFLSSDEMKAIR